MSAIASHAWPRISVVVPTLNQGAFIRETLQSILDQQYPELELIVVDGGSGDDTVDVIREFEDNIAWWVSEPDQGQADAIQKGLDRASGEIFNWINSDDYLAPGALMKVANTIGDNDILAGTTVNFSDSLESFVYSRNIDAWSLIADGLGTKSTWHQPALWLRADKLRAIGGIDTSMHYRFDLDLYVRYLSQYPRVAYTDTVLAYFRIHPESKTSTSQTAFRREHYQVIEKLRGESLAVVGSEKIDRLLRHMRWKDRITEIVRDSNGHRFLAVRRLVSEAMEQPWRIMNRYTRRYLRRLLFRQRSKL